MAKIAILNDEPEVVSLLSRFLTERGSDFMKLVGNTERVLDQVIAFQPDLILIPLYRTPEVIGRPIPDFDRDVRGAAVLAMASQAPELQHVPIVVFSFSVRPAELPDAFLARTRIDSFLLFPEGLQVLNPTISGILGPARGSTDDLQRLQSNIRALKRPPSSDG